VTKCEYCGTEIDLPFKCNYCGKYFCEAHRLLENHNCSEAPPRTPLGSYRTRQTLAENARKIEMETVSISDWKRTETKTYDNIHGHHFNVPIEIYSKEKYRDKLNNARTLYEVENIIRDYRKHHKTSK
jgi:6-pyruvoyl-tetrahydropterin synthase